MLLVVLALMVAPQSARAGAVAPLGPSHAPASQAVLDPATIVKGAFDSVRAYADPKTYVRAVRDIVEQTTGQKAYATADPPVSAPPSHASSSQDSADGVNRTALPIGDLSGDSLPDVVVLNEYFRPQDPSYVTHADLTALTGAGAKLWTFAIQRNAVVIPTVDVNDDGRADVLLVEYFADSPEDGQFECVNDSTCGGTYGNSFHWRFSLLSGRSGAPLNPITFNGKTQTILAFHYDLPRPTAQVVVVQATNALILPFVSDDHNGDGRREIILNAIDITTSYADEQFDLHPTAQVYVPQVALLTSTDATVRSGADVRTVLFEKKQALHSGEPALHLGEPAILLPAGNMIGDATGDLIWEGGANPEQGLLDVQGQQDVGDLLPLIPSLSPLTVLCFLVTVIDQCPGAQLSILNVQAYDGSRVTPFAPNWRNSYVEDPHAGKAPVDALTSGTEFFLQAFLVPLRAEVTGDTNQDLELIAVSNDYWNLLHSHGQTVENAHTYPSRLGIVSGLDGKELWTNGWVQRMWPIGSFVEGGPGELVATTANFDSGILTVDVLRFNGATGAIDGETFLNFPLAGNETWGYVTLDLVGDVNSDGVNDPVVSLVSTDSNGNSKSSIAVVSGKPGDGPPIYKELGRSGIRRADVAGDVNGDGRGDLYVEERIGTPGGFKVETTAIALPSGATVWKKVLMNATPNYDFRLQRAGDLFGLGHEAMVVQRVQFNPNETSEIAGLDGIDGAQQWSYGDATQSPGGSGYIDGKVVESGGLETPLDGVCVAAYNSGLHRVASDTTLSDGTYNLGPLLAGTYRVFFADCTRGSHRSQWYGGSPSSSEANTVSVLDNQTTFGINAVLESVSPPPNDLQQNAKDEGSDDSWSDVVNTMGAQTESGEPAPCNIGATVWYTFTAPSNETLTASASTDGFQSAVAVYAFSGVSPTQIGCSADDASGHNPGGSSVAFSAVQGMTYYVQAGGRDGAGGQLTVTLSPPVGP